MNEYRDQAQDKDWERVSELLHKADCVPEAPDSRAAVMARIARPKPVRRFVWAYAAGLGTLLVAAIGFAPMLMNSGQVDRVAESPRVEHFQPAPKATPGIKAPLYAQAPVPHPAPKSRVRVKHISPRKPVMMANADVSEARRLSGNVERPQLGPYYKAISPAAEAKSGPVHYYDDGAAKDTPRAEVAGDAVQPDMGTRYKVRATAAKIANYSFSAGYGAKPPARPEKRVLATVEAYPMAPAGGTAVLARDSFDKTSANALRWPAAAPIVMHDDTDSARPVAVAIVTWPSVNNRRADSYSYGYKNRDATGQTTECRVKRSGDSVEIYMESKPAVPEPPVKGSLEHETKPSA